MVTPQRYNHGTGPANYLRSDMVSSMDSVVSEDHFTRRHYNDIVFMLSYMDSEGDI